MFNRRSRACFAALLLVAVWFTTGEAAQSQDALAGDIDAFVERVIATGLTPGLAVGVVRAGHVTYAKGFGFADRESGRRVTPDTLFYLASTTKSFTALGAALLAQRGLIDLDAPVSRYLLGVAFHPSLSPDSITLRDLLTHTHGIKPIGPVDFRTAYSGEFSEGELLRLVRLHPAAPGGRAFAYSNVGYNIFSLALDVRFKEGWKEILQREVFEPLGMKSTTAWISRADPQRLAMPYEYRDGGLERVAYGKADSNMQAAGGHVSSVDDLLRYLAAELNDGRIGDRQVLPVGVVASTQRAQVDQNRNFGPFHRTAWGLGWDIATYEGDTILQRFGDFSGFRSHVSFMPDRGVGVVVLSNGGSVSSPFTDLVATYIYDRILGKPDLVVRYDGRLTTRRQQVDAIKKDRATRQARPQTTPLPWAAYVGTYESEALGHMAWTLDEAGRLTVRMGLARGNAEVYDGSQYQFRVDLAGSGSVVTFVVPDGATAPTALRFADQTFLRVGLE
ncbi:MAG: class A beta-lactamase-related serine hydrolase [Acidobacteria bacterium]|nr:class A beta-lactamase-related serine hydrolase [Acidobacteriota bacterium]